METEAEFKHGLIEVMGREFVDALYEGTTSETLRESFLLTLRTLYNICKANGKMPVSMARFTLEQLNPGKQYNGVLFEYYATRSLDGIWIKAGQWLYCPTIEGTQTYGTYKVVDVVLSTAKSGDYVVVDVPGEGYLKVLVKNL